MLHHLKLQVRRKLFLKEKRSFYTSQMICFSLCFRAHDKNYDSLMSIEYQWEKIIVFHIGFLMSRIPSWYAQLFFIFNQTVWIIRITQICKDSHVQRGEAMIVTMQLLTIQILWRSMHRKSYLKIVALVVMNHIVMMES